MRISLYLRLFQAVVWTQKQEPFKFKSNIQFAADVYCPCGEGNISLFEGADSTKLQEIRSVLIKFLKGSKAIEK